MLCGHCHGHSFTREDDGAVVCLSCNRPASAPTSDPIPSYSVSGQCSEVAQGRQFTASKRLYVTEMAASPFGWRWPEGERQRAMPEEMQTAAREQERKQSPIKLGWARAR